MLIDIFSSFDPACNSLYSLSPILFWGALVAIIVLFSSFWSLPSLTFFITRTLRTSSLQISSAPAASIKGLVSLTPALLITLILVNLAGLLPYVFRIRSHILFTLSLALPLWLSLILSSIIWNTSSFIANLLPRGAPGWLNWFLLLVEITRVTARPIILAFRLTANIRAGHIILTLISDYLTVALFSSSITSRAILIFITAFYTLVEVGICLLQAYIFCLLIALYTTEHAH